MPLALSFELRMEERSARRVVVSVLLAPEPGATVRIDGVALQLHRRTGEPLGVQMVLPIAGELRNPMLSTVELRTDDEDIPPGSKVVGSAWQGAEQREATLPTDPFHELEVHMRARRRVVVPLDDVDLERLVPEERAVLARDYPWIDEPMIRAEVPQITVVDSDDGDPIDGVVDDLGLDDESASWLKDLLHEESASS